MLLIEMLILIFLFRNESYFIVCTLLHSNTNINIVPLINKIVVSSNTIFVCTVNLLNFLLFFIFSIISSQTVNPNPPIMINDIIVKHTNQFSEYTFKLSAPIKSNPALQNADIE